MKNYNIREDSMCSHIHYVHNNDDNPIIQEIYYKQTRSDSNSDKFITVQIKFAYDNPNIQELFEILPSVSQVYNRKIILKNSNNWDTVHAFFRLIQEIDPLPLDAFYDIGEHLAFNFTSLIKSFQKTKIPSYFRQIYTPDPPPLPNDTVKGFTSEGYWELIQSLSIKDRRVILKELEAPSIIARASKLEGQLACCEMVVNDLPNSRNTFLAALLCLQQNKINKNQLATLHIVDSAIRTLYTSPAVYLIHKQVENNKLVRNISVFFPEVTKGFPKTIQQLQYHRHTTVDESIVINDLPMDMRQPLIHRFFNFTDLEWLHFKNEIEQAPGSEQLFFVLAAPEFGCWSSIIFLIQKVLKCMQIMECFVPLDNQLIRENIMIIPSFSMFQAAINAKANTLGRTPVQLIPTYYFLEPTLYARNKSVGRIPLSLYLPEQNPALRYHNSKGQFRTVIDGHLAETAFAGATHDVYHAFREMMMSEQVASARIRLAAIAKVHHYNKKSPTSRPVDDILIDGELIFSYPSEKNSIFNQSGLASIFGDLFDTPMLADCLHDSLKKDFILDMVEHKEEWLVNFNIGRDDLRAADQVIYDELEEAMRLESIHNHLHA